MRPEGIPSCLWPLHNLQPFTLGGGCNVIEVIDYPRYFAPSSTVFDRRFHCRSTRCLDRSVSFASS
jgi:hypothetical protein